MRIESHVAEGSRRSRGCRYATEMSRRGGRVYCLAVFRSGQLCTCSFD